MTPSGVFNEFGEQNKNVCFFLIIYYIFIDHLHFYPNNVQ